MEIFRFRLTFFAGLLIAFFTINKPLHAQADVAQLSGMVTDQSGAMIPKAEISIVNQSTGIIRHLRSNDDGQYSALALQPGSYRITVEAPGFKTLVVQHVTLNVAQKGNLNFELVIGAVSEAITVNGGVLNTTDASVGTVVDRHFVNSIPLNGRSFQALVLLSPSVVTADPQGDDSSGEYSVNGQRTSANGFTLDGASAMNQSSSAIGGPGSTGSVSNATGLGTTQAIVSLDALQEFRIATSTYSAEFGRQSGAQISFTSRSGSNDCHGTLFDYLRNYEGRRRFPPDHSLPRRRISVFRPHHLLLLEDCGAARSEPVL